jgi:hypothetical protein
MAWTVPSLGSRPVISGIRNMLEAVGLKAKNPQRCVEFESGNQFQKGFDKDATAATFDDYETLEKSVLQHFYSF